MITIDTGAAWVALAVMILGAAMLGAFAGAYIVIRFREALFRLELRRAREATDRARWNRLMGLDEAEAGHGQN